MLKNLQRQAREDPTDGDVQLQLGRVHGAAWARASERVTVEKRSTDLFFGHQPALVPFAADKQNRGAEHLRLAILHHRRAVALLQSDEASLGLAYLLSQRKADRAEAVQLLRKLIEKHAPTESTAGGFTYEAAGYLIPLLDPHSDATELGELNARREKLERTPRPVTPIAIPRGATVLHPSARVRFDLAGRDRAKRWPWIAPDVA